MLTNDHIGDTKLYLKRSRELDKCKSWLTPEESLGLNSLITIEYAGISYDELLKSLRGKYAKKQSSEQVNS